MKVVLLVADAARLHPDNTFSLLRGGIDRVSGLPGQPIVFRGTITVMIRCEPPEAGKHQLRLSCVDDAGNLITQLKAEFDAPPAAGRTTLPLDFNLTLPRPGNYRFEVVVDDVQQDAWPFQAVAAAAEGGAKK